MTPNWCTFALRGKSDIAYFVCDNGGRAGRHVVISDQKGFKHSAIHMSTVTPVRSTESENPGLMCDGLTEDTLGCTVNF